MTDPTPAGGKDLYTVDIGSTVLKFARVDSQGKLIDQQFEDRDFDAEIVDQLDGLLDSHAAELCPDNLVICSSANGGLRVGVVCLSSSYSGAVLRNQVLLGGANPVFFDEIRQSAPNPAYVDVLLVGGGIDCPDYGPMEMLISRFSPSNYSYGSLVYAGNRHLAAQFKDRFPEARIIDNPMADGLGAINDTVFVALRDAYLDDLVYKRGVSEVAHRFAGIVCPTPEVVNKGYYKVITEQLFPEMTGASILIDIGGATTDFHYTVEVVRDDSVHRPASGTSVARYVFTDLGVFASRDSTVMQLRRNPRTFEFLETVFESDVSEIYRLLREGDFEPQPGLLACACVFLGLDRFSRGGGPGLPTADLGKLDKLVLTGGAAQMIEEEKAAAIASLFLSKPVDAGFVMIDRRYEIWVQGAIAHRRTEDSDDRATRPAAAS